MNTNQGQPMNYIFDATQHKPDQGGEKHPIGKFPAQIAATEVKPNSEGTGGYFQVTFKTPAGQIKKQYSLWHTNPQTVEIAHNQLTALSYCIGIFKIDMNTQGVAIIGSNLMIEVGEQTGKNANKDYNQVSRVYDVNGNEPGKTGGQQQQPANAFNQGGFAPQQPQQQVMQPQQQQPMQPVQGQPVQQAPQAQPQQGGWGGPAPAAAAPVQQAPAQNWQQQPAPANGANPSWNGPR